MRQKSNARDKQQSLAPHFIAYDHHNVSPAFSSKQIAYIESIKQDFEENDLERIRSIEDWILNTNTGWLNNGALPGLRSEQGIGVCYFQRFNEENFNMMVGSFLDQVCYAFGKFGPPCHMPLFRVTVPNGNRYYPILYHTDVETWVRVLDEAAANLKTTLGWFRKGKFVVSDGNIYPFSSISVEEPDYVPVPEDW